MIDGWRELLYPLGFLAALAFGSRSLLQWLASEIRRESIVTSTFWKLSLVGNVLLLLHSFLQLQYHVFIVQVCNAVISWRNLNLMQPVEMHLPTKNVIKIMGAAFAGSTILYIFQGFIFDNIAFFRIPTNIWTTPPERVNLFWHILGFIGLILFSSRFWIQWWFAEQQQASFLGRHFWWASLIGDFLCLVYFFQIKDPVNLIGPTLGLVPYIRNLILDRRKQQTRLN